MYGVDLDDAVAMGRSWHWFTLRVAQLLTIPPTITPDGDVIQATRLGHVLYPPTRNDDG